MNTGKGGTLATATKANTGLETTNSDTPVQEKDSFKFAFPPTVKFVPTDDLSPHPLNETIYGNDIDEVFVEAVRRNGIYTPLLVTEKNIIISGHRRHEAAKRAGILKVPVVVFASNDELDIKAALVEANKQRVKTNRQIGAEYNLLAEVESERARKRMATNGRRKGRKKFSPAGSGKTRDIVAEQISDKSGVTTKRAGDVVKEIERLQAGSEQDQEFAAKLAAKLDRRINAAWKLLKAQDKAAEGPAKSVKKGTKASKDEQELEGIAQPLQPDPQNTATPQSGRIEIDSVHDVNTALRAATKFLQTQEPAELTEYDIDDLRRYFRRLGEALANLGIGEI